MRCETCVLVAAIRDKGLAEMLATLWNEECANCGCIRGGHHADHPHGRFGYCPGFAFTRSTIEDVLEDLVAIEQSLR